MRPKLIVMDIDGTLVGSTDTISPRTLSAIDMARDSGAAIALATGRRLRATQPIAELLRIELPLICLNGALVVDPQSLQPISITPMDHEVALSAVKTIHDWGQPALVYHHTLTPPDVIYSVEPAHPAMRGYLEREGENVAMVTDLAPHLQRALRVLTFGDSREVDPITAAMSGSLGPERAWVLTTMHRGLAHLEIYEAGVSKGKALSQLAASIDVPLEQVVAFGDGPNDVDLLDVAGIGIAMDNGVPETKQAADMVTVSQAEDGVAVILEQLFG